MKLYPFIHRARRRSLTMLAGGLVAMPLTAATPAKEDVIASFKREIQPVLNEYCYDCHGNGVAKGGITLDRFSTNSELRDHELWLRALRNVRSGIMPPVDEAHLPPEQAEKLSRWIKRRIFDLDPAVPDPGRVTVRRLNRLEYRNTIRDLVGLDFDTKREFPADDSGHGFDNIGDVLTVSPMLLEKYLDAAQTIVSSVVPSGPAVVAEKNVPGRQFAVLETKKIADRVPTAAELKMTVESGSASATADEKPKVARPAPAVNGTGLDLSFYTPVVVTAKHRLDHAGDYQLVLELRTTERYVEDKFDYNQCRLVFRVDGEQLFAREFSRDGGKSLTFPFDRRLAAGEHEFSCEIQPVGEDRPQIRQLRLRLNGVTVRGPMAKEYWVPPKDYAKFFPRATPKDLAGQRAYAGEILGKFAARAFRRPVDDATVARLVSLAEKVFVEPGNTFEAGVSQAMVAVLASPRFIFREEGVEPLRAGQAHPLIDEYALASRLSYFFWSTMPDAELLRLAQEHGLRAALPAQITRLMSDARAGELTKNFTGQWLQSRDISTVVLDENAIFQREHPVTEAAQKARATLRRIIAIPEDKRTPEDVAALAEARKARGDRGRPMVPPLSGSLRQAMQDETEMFFAHIVREDRPLTELLDCDYTFLNEELAKHYGIDGVSGRAMRKVTLAPDSPRGGVLTQGTVLAVTSNPTRTSPVKRGVFILDSILGTPTAPPPPNIPPLEDAVSPEKLRQMTLRENLAAHATNPLCFSCHSRMDPLGLALENFNAMGQWRTAEMNRPIEPAGKLITGETFAEVRELKRILATSRRGDFYHCVSEKLLTYALGRGLDYRDTETLDQLVAKLEASGGRPSVLIRAIVESAPFQQRRRPPSVSTASLDSLTP
ncbi:MAG: DUF1592 domain-containing protein [Verrucomicrobia bacterium]|nr:DUF1592 domain-containing protein [Verrucomicrobiota bacterium]